MDFVRRCSEKTEIGAGRFIEWLNITASKFYDWRERYGKVNARDFRLEGWEKQAIIGFHLKNPLEGYRLTFIMLDAEKSNAGTNRSKGSASGREHHCRWKMHDVLWRAMSSITTMFV